MYLASLPPNSTERTEASGSSPHPFVLPLPESLATVSSLKVRLGVGERPLSIHIGISEYILDRLKNISAKEVFPYQMLISSGLHKFVTNQLVDEKSIIQSIKLMNH